jgi:hypothetical protein
MRNKKLNLTGIHITPVVSYPAFAGNSVRVQQLFNLFSELGCNMNFVLHPCGVVSDCRQGNQMRNTLGNKYFELNKGNIYRGAIWQKILNFVKRRLGGKFIVNVDDFMFKDAFVNKKLEIEFQEIIAEIKPDFIVVEYAVLAKFIANIDPNIITFVDTHDCFSNRNQRIRAAGGQGLWFNLTPIQEQQLLSRFDYVLSIQENESTFFKQLLEESQTEVVTLSIIEAAKRDSYVEKNENTIGFLGSQNGHNLEGLKQFLDCHWMKIRELKPDARMLVAGADFKELHSWKLEGVEFIGRVDNIDDYYDECCFFINPCITGSGLKIKSVEALAHGKGLVTTPEGAEGLNEAMCYGLYNAPLTSDEFYQHCIDFLDSQEMRQTKGYSNIDFVNSQYKKNCDLLTVLLEKSLLN